jgi:hypothetical protein
MRLKVLVFSALGMLIGLGVAWFLATHDRAPAREWVGPSGEARLREFLAAQRFAERMGMEVAEVRSLPELEALPAQGVLVMPHRRQLPPGRIAELLRWVESGGHLIAEAEHPGLADPLLDQLGVKRSKADVMAKPLVVELPSGNRARAFLPATVKLETGEPDVRLRAGSGLLSYARGRGQVTVAATLRFARNPSHDEKASIGAHDHAALLWGILSLTPARELRFYFRPERLSFWSFLREHAAPALAAGALLLVLWLWSIAPRFGPVAPDAPPGRRRLLDHLRASGRYFWVKGLRARLVAAARDAAVRRIARAQPDFVAASPAERAARVSALTGIPKDEAARFLGASGPMRGAEFIRLTQYAQRVHSALEKGTKK